jgi:hypothetical protein
MQLLLDGDHDRTAVATGPAHFCLLAVAHLLLLLHLC